MLEKRKHFEFGILTKVEANKAHINSRQYIPTDIFDLFHHFK